MQRLAHPVWQVNLFHPASIWLLQLSCCIIPVSPWVAAVGPAVRPSPPVTKSVSSSGSAASATVADRQ